MDDISIILEPLKPGVIDKAQAHNNQPKVIATADDFDWEDDDYL